MLWIVGVVAGLQADDRRTGERLVQYKRRGFPMGRSAHEPLEEGQARTGSVAAGEAGLQDIGRLAHHAAMVEADRLHKGLEAAGGHAPDQAVIAGEGRGLGRAGGVSEAVDHSVVAAANTTILDWAECTDMPQAGAEPAAGP